MAMIPELWGEVVEICALDRHYYKSKFVLRNSKRSYTGGEEYSEPQIVKCREDVKELHFKVGDQVSTLAFTLSEPNTWESEGVWKI